MKQTTSFIQVIFLFLCTANSLHAIDTEQIDQIASILDSNQNLDLLNNEIIFVTGKNYEEAATPLAYALLRGKYQAALTLLTYQPDLNKYYKKRANNATTYKTPLYIAAEQGNYHLVNNLINAGAQIDKGIEVTSPGKPSMSHNALWIAQERKNQDDRIIKLLEQRYHVAQGAKIAPQLAVYQAGLIKLIETGTYQELSALLVQYPSLANEKIVIGGATGFPIKKDLWMTAMLPYPKGKLKKYHYLRKVGEWFEEHDKTWFEKHRKTAPTKPIFGKYEQYEPNFWEETVTPLYLAMVNGREDMVQLLLKKGANPNVGYKLTFSLNFRSKETDPEDFVNLSERPLFFAARINNLPLVKLLLAQKDIDVNTGYSLVVATQTPPAKKVAGLSIFEFTQSPLSIAKENNKGTSKLTEIQKALQLKEAQGIKIKKWPVRAAAQAKLSEPERKAKEKKKREKTLAREQAALKAAKKK